MHQLCCSICNFKLVSGMTTEYACHLPVTVSFVYCIMLKQTSLGSSPGLGNTPLISDCSSSSLKKKLIVYQLN